MEIPSENEIMEIYEWVDTIQLTRPKKNIARDFSDGGTFMLTINKYYSPKLLNNIYQR